MSSPSRRWATAGALIAFGALLVLAFGRADGSSAEAVPQRGNVGSCASLAGDQARACYSREVGRELAAIGGTGNATPRAFKIATSTTVTFADADPSAALLCDLHVRVGRTDVNKASWTNWVAQ